MHVDAVKKNTRTFEHIVPETVGNARRLLVSEIAGKAAVLELIKRIRPDFDKASPEVDQVLTRIKKLEHDGYSFEAAEASQELLVCRELGIYKPFFELERITVNSEYPHIGELSASSFIKIHVDGKAEVTAEEGDGPINAIDMALRKAMEVFYPELKRTRLSDYKVRVLNRHATASSVRVLIETTDGERTWRTVGVSTDIITASYQALADSLEYPLMIARLNRL
jgi:2-isopropylmalate synthase